MSSDSNLQMAANSASATVDTGPACNNRCATCYRAAQAGETWPPLALPAGDGPILIHGGEPLLHPELEALIGLARERGRAVTLDTNARALAADGRALRLKQAGLGHVVFTLHGASEASHDFMTRTPGSFRQTIAGVMKLRAAGVRLTARLMVSRSSLLELHQMSKMALGVGAQAIRFSFARMEPFIGMIDLSAANAIPRNDEKGVLRVDPNTPAGDRTGYDQAREWLVPRYAAAAEALGAAMRAIQKLGMPVVVDGMPLCLLPAGARAAPSTPACSLPESPNDSYAPCCEGCAERARCPGVPRGYLARFGDGELRPIPQA